MEVPKLWQKSLHLQLALTSKNSRNILMVLVHCTFMGVYWNQPVNPSVGRSVGLSVCPQHIVRTTCYEPGVTRK